MTSRTKRPALAAFALCAVTTSTEARAGALDQVSDAIAQQLGAAANAPVHVVLPAVSSDVPNAREADLAARLVERLAAQLPKRTTAKLAAPGDRSAAKLVLQAKIVKGVLGVTADWYAAQGNGWDRVRSPSPAAAGHAYATARIDAEVRSFLPPILLEQATLHRAKAPGLVGGDDQVVALGCGEVDDGAGLVLVVVTRDRVKLGRLVHETLAVSDDLAWSDLVPRAPVVLREPLGGVSFFAGALAVGTSDRGGVRLARDESSGTLRAASTLAGVPVSGSGACAKVTPETGSFGGPPATCAAGGLPMNPPVTGAYDAVARIDDVQKDGSSIDFAGFRGTDGTLHLAFGSKPSTMSDVGAAVALGDLDLDGVPEIATTRNVDPDALVVTTLGASAPKLRFPAPAGVRAVAACPAEERGAPAFAAIVGDEVWLVR